MKAKKSKKSPKAGPFVKTARAKKTPGKTVAAGGTQVIKAPGKKPLAFKKGALHVQLEVPQGEKIPVSKLKAAAVGKHGPLAKKRALFAINVLKKGRMTARKKNK